MLSLHRVELFHDPKPWIKRCAFIDDDTGMLLLTWDRSLSRDQVDVRVVASSHRFFLAAHHLEVEPNVIRRLGSSLQLAR